MIFWDFFQPIIYIPRMRSPRPSSFCEVDALTWTQDLNKHYFMYSLLLVLKSCQSIWSPKIYNFYGSKPKKKYHGVLGFEAAQKASYPSNSLALNGSPDALAFAFLPDEPAAGPCEGSWQLLVIRVKNGCPHTRKMMTRYDKSDGLWFLF